MFGIQLRVVIAGVIGLLVLSMVAAAFWHYTRTVAANGLLQSQVATLDTAVKTQANTIEAQREAIEAWDQHSRDMARRMDALVALGEEAQQETRRLNELFRTHNLGNLAAQRPGLIEDRINGGTDRARCLLEQASGAPRPNC